MSAANRAHGAISNQSPEMVRQDAVGAPQDIWSLGCLLFELITGECLFPSEFAQLHTLFMTHGEVRLVPPTKQCSLAPRDFVHWQAVVQHTGPNLFVLLYRLSLVTCAWQAA